MKFIILIGSVIIQLCLGGVYAWSSVVPALEETLGMSISQTQIVFGGGAYHLGVDFGPYGRSYDTGQTCSRVAPYLLYASR